MRYSGGEDGWGTRGFDTQDEEGPSTSATVDATPLDQAAAKGKRGKQPPDASGHGGASWCNGAPEPLPSTQAGPAHGEEAR